jgi:hypothetical protein
MTELNQSTIKSIAKTLNAIHLKNRTEADKVVEPLNLVAFSVGMYGVNAKLWQGRTTKQFYFATNYSVNLYRF